MMGRLFNWLIVVLFLVVMVAITIPLFVADLVTLFRFKFVSRFWDYVMGGLWSALH